MSRSWVLFLRDMRDEAKRIRRFVDGRDRREFLSDEMAYYATARSLEILGEAAKKIPLEVRSRHPEVDWKGVAGLRDVLAHAYFGIDDVVLWEIVTVKVPQLIEQLDRIKEPLG